MASPGEAAVARPRSVVPRVDTHITLPVDLSNEISLLLFSELQGRVPLGAAARFFERAARDLLAKIKSDPAYKEQL